MIVYHLSDLHLDSPLRGLSAYEGCPREAIRGASRKALSKAIGSAIAEKASLVVIAGDLYDGDWRDYATGLFFVQEMRRLRVAGIPVVIVRGNHDAESEMQKSLPLPDNVTELSTEAPESKLFETLGIAVHGRGFPSREVTEDLAKQYPRALPGYFNLGVLHTSLTGRPGHEPYAPTRQEVLIDRGYDYWALGHVHKRDVVAREPWIVFSGNLQGRHIKELGPKGFTAIEIEGGRVKEVVHRAVDVVRWDDRVVEVPEAGGKDELRERIGRALGAAAEEAGHRLACVRLTLVGASSLHADLVRAVEPWIHDAQALALDLAGDRLWLADLRVQTAPPRGEIAFDARHPLFELFGAELATLTPEEIRPLIADLLDKLPADVLERSPFRELSEPSSAASVTAWARELLLSRLEGGSKEEA